MKVFLRNISVLVLFLLFMLAVACNREKTLLDLNVKGENLKHKLVNINSILHKTDDLSVVDSLLFVMDETNEMYFAVYNLNSNDLLFRFGKKGKGPGEMKWPLFMKGYQKQKVLEVTAIQPKGIIRYNIDSLINFGENYKPNTVEFKLDKNTLLTVNQLNDSIYIAKGGIHEGQFAFFNELSELKSIQGNYPTEKETIDYKQFLLGMSYQGDIKTHPKLSKFVYTSMVGSLIEFCQLDKDNRLKKYKTYYNDFPKFKVVGNNAVLLSNNIIGFNSLFVTDSFVYVLYSDKNVMDYNKNPYSFNTILKFDWSGNLIKKYITDIKIRAIAVSPNDEIIYGTSLNPEPIIVKFEI